MDKRTDLILGTLQQLSSPEWWKQWGLHGVVLYSWALPKFTPVIRAIKAAGAQVIIPLDGDGSRSARQWPLRFLNVSYVYARMSTNPVVAPFYAFLQTGASLLKFRHAGALEHMAEADFLAIQSPLAQQRFTRFAEWAGAPGLREKLVLLHHPISSHMKYDAGIAKEKLIIAVGAWDRLIKGSDMLVRVLTNVLERNAEYRAVIIGGGNELVLSKLRSAPTGISSRIRVTGPLPNTAAVAYYQSSQILLNTSYSEGFSLAAAEALCCGCSVVGSANISCFNYFTSESSGTMATRRTLPFYQDALCAEIEAWALGMRNPEAISATWTSRLHAPAVARKVLSLVRSA